MPKYRYIYLMMSVLLTIQVSAQEEPTGGIEDAQIIIEKDTDLTLPKASKIYKPSQVKPITSDTVHLSYNFSSPKFQYTTYPFNAVPSALKTGGEENTERTNYLMAGFGNYTSPLIRAGLSQARDIYSVGLTVDHESYATGPVRDEESAYSVSHARLSGGIAGDQFSITPYIGWDRESYYFYGKDSAYELGDVSDERVANSGFQLGTGLSAHQGSAYFQVLPSYRYRAMRAAGEAFNSEHHFDFTGTARWKMNDQWKANLFLDYDFMSYDGDAQSRNVFNARPTASFANDVLTLELGINFSAAGDALGNASGIYPVVDASYSVTETLDVFALVQGKIMGNTLENLALANRYLEDSLLLYNEKVKFDGKVGVALKFGEGWQVRPYLGYKSLENKALFGKSQMDTSRYDLYYSNDFSDFAIGGDIAFLSGATSFQAGLSLHTYTTDTTYEEAWYLPAFQLDASISRKFGESWSVRSSMAIRDGLRGFYSTSLDPVDLPMILDVTAMAEYRFNDQWGAFLLAQNLFHIQYEQYLDYPVRGIAVKAGITYQF